jgi:hypothetical protein
VAGEQLQQALGLHWCLAGIDGGRICADPCHQLGVLHEQRTTYQDA